VILREHNRIAADLNDSFSGFSSSTKNILGFDLPPHIPTDNDPLSIFRNSTINRCGRLILSQPIGRQIFRFQTRSQFTAWWRVVLWSKVASNLWGVLSALAANEMRVENDKAHRALVLQYGWLFNFCQVLANRVKTTSCPTIPPMLYFHQPPGYWLRWKKFRVVGMVHILMMSSKIFEAYLNVMLWFQKEISKRVIFPSPLSLF
jgi:hypothetical protein